MLHTKSKDAAAVSRRRFLQASAAFGGGLLIGWVEVADAAETSAVDAPASEFAPNAFIRIDRAGKVTVISPCIEMGQGTYTALPMLVAEELDVDMREVAYAHSPPSDKLYANPLIGGQITGGSAAIRGFYKPLREAGAAARRMLVKAAAARLGVDASELTTADGQVIHSASGQKIGYGALVDDAAKLPVPTTLLLKDPSEFRIIGTPVKRLDGPEKVDGTAKFGIDAQDSGHEGRDHRHLAGVRRLACLGERGGGAGRAGRASGGQARRRRGGDRRSLLGGEKGPRCGGAEIRRRPARQAVDSRCGRRTRRRRRSARAPSARPREMRSAR